jgi:predicted nucleic acid-binding Zn ribbon protein
MTCMCGGCRDCLTAQGYTVPEVDSCVVCGAPLATASKDFSGFCSSHCEACYAAEMQARDAALALQLAEEAHLAETYWAEQRAEHDAVVRSLLLRRL